MKLASNEQLFKLRQRALLREHIDRQRRILKTGLDLTGHPLSDAGRRWVEHNLDMTEERLRRMYAAAN